MSSSPRISIAFKMCKFKIGFCRLSFCRFVVVSSQRCQDLWWSNVVDILLGIVAMKMRFLPQILQNSL